MASRFEEIMKKMNDNNQSLLMEYVEANFVTRLVLWDGESRGISDDPGPGSNQGTQMMVRRFFRSFWKGMIDRYVIEGEGVKKKNFLILNNPMIVITSVFRESLLKN